MGEHHENSQNFNSQDAAPEEYAEGDMYYGADQAPPAAAGAAEQETEQGFDQYFDGSGFDYPYDAEYDQYGDY